MTRVSFRQFAQSINVAHSAVSKAATTGRLSKSVARDARGPYIKDLALARREWRANATKLPAPRPLRAEVEAGEVEEMVLLAMGFVLTKHLPATIVSSHDGWPDRFDVPALRAFLRQARAEMAKETTR